jgi:tRNA(Ile)-lysidine synthase
MSGASGGLSDRSDSSHGSTLIAKLLQTIPKHGMFSPGDRVVVAVSGGPDSVALLHALHSLRDELGISLHVAHLNHGIRGKEADEDAVFVAEMAARLDIPCSIEKADVPAIRKSLRLSVEEAARNVRYEFLDRVADSVGAARIATAHTADDQAETVLMNLIRGAGADGLAGIPPVRGRYVRPMLEVTRAEVESYCKDSDLPCRIDASNLRPDYRRNRIRLELLPLLQDQYNAGVKSALASTAEIMHEESGLLTQLATAVYQCAEIVSDPGQVVLEVTQLSAAHLALRRRCIRMAIEAVKGDLKDVAFRQVERIISLMDSGVEFTLTLPSGRVYVRMEGQTLRFYRAEPDYSPQSVEMDLPVPGVTACPHLGVEVTAEILSPPVNYRRPPGSLDVVLDLSKVKGQLILRNWRKGDRIRPLGMAGEKKLQDIFSDARIPRGKKHLVPVIADQEKIIWVAGFVLSEDVRVTDSSTELLRLVCGDLAESW